MIIDQIVRDLLEVIQIGDQSSSNKELLSKRIKNLLIEYRYPLLRPPYYIEKELELINEELRNINNKISACECKCSSPSSDNTLRLITVPGGRDEANNTLRDWLKGARVIEIADPYFFAKGSYKDESHLLSALNSILPSSLKRIHIYYKPKPSKIIINPITELLRNYKVTYQFHATYKLHDRVWIKDGNKAKIVGTSFNGLGNKLAFILDLPNKDLLQFQERLVVIRNGKNG